MRMLSSQKLVMATPYKLFTLLSATYACPSVKISLPKSRTARSMGTPCTLWMVMAQAKVSGYCSALESKAAVLG